jgi:hypothetical protein
VLCQQIDEVVTLVEGAPRDATALVSTWALSEMPLQLRERAQALLAISNISSAIFAYQADFSGIDNKRYFHELAKRTGGLWSWQHFEIDLFPSNFYLLGSKRPSATPISIR